MRLRGTHSISRSKECLAKGEAFERQLFEWFESRGANPRKATKNEDRACKKDLVIDTKAGRPLWIQAKSHNRDGLFVVEWRCRGGKDGYLLKKDLDFVAKQLSPDKFIMIPMVELREAAYEWFGRLAPSKITNQRATLFEWWSRPNNGEACVSVTIGWVEQNCPGSRIFSFD